MITIIWIDLQVFGEPPDPQVKRYSIHQCSGHFKYVIGENKNQDSMGDRFTWCNRYGVGKKVSDQNHCDGIHHLARQGGSIVS